MHNQKNKNKQGTTAIRRIRQDKEQSTEEEQEQATDNQMKTMKSRHKPTSRGTVTIDKERSQ